MQQIEKLRIRSFETRQVADRLRIPAGLCPAAIGFFPLISQGKRHADTLGQHRTLGPKMNFPQALADEFNELFVAALTRLQTDGAVSVVSSPDRSFHNFLFGHCVALDVVVGLANAAVAAIGRADV